MTKSLSTADSTGQLLLYQTEDGLTKLEVKLVDKTVWLTHAEMATLFQKDIRTINEHLKNIFEERELEENSVIRKFRITAKDGKNYNTLHYSLDAIISVGYRVKSHRGTQFRQWATQRLQEYIIKGFTMDDERLKQVSGIGSDYFDEMLERIRDIRSSEKRFYQKIRDIYKLAVDYDPRVSETLEFFQIVQNKLHFAVSGKTAAGLIAERADASKSNMGLTSWHGAKVRKTDVTIAKNYLNEEEISQLNRIVTMYLDYAEDQARRRKQIFMKDWREKLDAFLKFNERDILTNAGKITKAIADQLALNQYEIYHQTRLSQEAEQEALEDDKVLKAIEAKISKKRKKK